MGQCSSTEQHQLGYITKWKQSAYLVTEACDFVDVQGTFQKQVSCHGPQNMAKEVERPLVPFTILNWV